MAGNSGVGGPGLDRYQRVMYGIAMVFGRYMWSRLDAVAAARHWGDLPEGTWGARAWQSLRWAENVFQLGSLLNFIVFMRVGTYRCTSPSPLALIFTLTLLNVIVFTQVRI